MSCISLTPPPVSRSLSPRVPAAVLTPPCALSCARMQFGERKPNSIGLSADSVQCFSETEKNDVRSLDLERSVMASGLCSRDASAFRQTTGMEMDTATSKNHYTGLLIMTAPRPGNGIGYVAAPFPCTSPRPPCLPRSLMACAFFRMHRQLPPRQRRHRLLRGIRVQRSEHSALSAG